MSRKKKVDITDNTLKTQEEKWEDLQAKRLVPTTALNDVKLNSKQIELIKLIDENDIVVIMGPAGTSKTFVSCYYAIQSLKNHQFDKIILTKPIKESGEELGFLPGDIAQKIDPYYESYKNNFEKIIKPFNYERLIEKNVILCKPLAYMRGINIDNSLMILDEAQNCSWKQIMLFVTRMGKSSKTIISGDVSQYDIQKNMMALLGFSDMIKDVNNVGIFSFDRKDIMRHKILIEITDKYEELKYSGKIKEEK